MIVSADAAAKLLQSRPTLCDPIDGSPPGSSVPGILQARTLEWVAIAFSNAGKWEVHIAKTLRECVWPCMCVCVKTKTFANKWLSWLYGGCSDLMKLLFQASGHGQRSLLFIISFGGRCFINVCSLSLSLSGYFSSLVRWGSSPWSFYFFFQSLHYFPKSVP